MPGRQLAVWFCDEVRQTRDTSCLSRVAVDCNIGAHAHFQNVPFSRRHRDLAISNLYTPEPVSILFHFRET